MKRSSSGCCFGALTDWFGVLTKPPGSIVDWTAWEGDALPRLCVVFDCRIFSQTGYFIADSGIMEAWGERRIQ